MSLKDEVYAAIRVDFEQNSGASFLLVYLKQEKQRRLEKYLEHPERGKLQRDPYVLLLFHYQNIRDDNDIERKKRYLQILAAELKRSPKLKLGSVEQQILEDCAGMDGVFKGDRRNIQEYNRMLSLLYSAPPVLSLLELKRLHQNVSYRILTLEAKALLYDAIDGGKGSGGMSGSVSGRKPKVDRMLNLFCEYLEWQGISTLSKAAAGAGVASASVSEERIKDWDRLLAILNRNGMSEKERLAAVRVMLPVRVDPETGAAVYIVGAKRFSDSRTVKAKTRGKNCCCVGFYPNDFAVRDTNAEQYSWPEICCLWEDYDGSLDDMFYPNVREAMTWYEKELLRNARESFRDENGVAPKGCPEALKTYFSAF